MIEMEVKNIVAETHDDAEKRLGMSRGKKVGFFVTGLCLCVLIGVGVVGLVGWLGGGVATQQYPTSLHDPELEAINDAVGELFLDEAILVYEGEIGKSDTELRRAKLRIEYGRYLMELDLFEDGRKQLDLVDDSILDAGYKILLYSSYRNYYEHIGDEDMANEYNENISEVVSNSEYAAGG